MGPLLVLAMASLGSGPAAGEAKPRPTVAVVGLSAKQGVHADVAELLTEAVVDNLRRGGRFSRVVSASEIQAAVSFEAQKQLLDCDETSCMREVAGAFGVDYLVTGSVGRLGDTWLFSLRLIRVATVTTEGALSQPLEGASEAVLLKAVGGMVDTMMQASSVPPAAGAGAPSATAAQADTPSSPRVGVWAARTVGLLGVLGAAVMAGMAVAGAVAAGGTYVVFNYVPGFARFQAPMQALVIVGVVVLGLASVLLVPSIGVGAGGWIGSIFLG